MTKTWTYRGVLGASAVAAGLAFGGAALAGGSVKDDPAPGGRKLAISFNIGGTSDYVFRGVSQSNEEPAIQGGVDITYGILYSGVWASKTELGAGETGEVDIYAGIKPTWGPLTFDFGGIYYAYPNSISALDVDYFEFKAGVSGAINKLTLGTTLFYSPDYTFGSGAVWTVEGTAAYELPKTWVFTPTVSALIGYQTGDDADYDVNGFGKDSYVYWNVGVALAVEKLTIDFRYWDTDIGSANSNGIVCTSGGLCDQRFVASAKVTF